MFLSLSITSRIVTYRYPRHKLFCAQAQKLYIFSHRTISSRNQASQARFGRIRDAARMDSFEYKLKSTGIFTGISSQREHESRADRIRRFYKWQDKNGSRASARLSRYTRWIHKYKLLNFVTRFKFAPTGASSRRDVILNSLSHQGAPRDDVAST